MINTPHLRTVKIWAQLNNPQNIDLLKRGSVDLDIDEINTITDQSGMEALISRLPDQCSQAQIAVQSDEGIRDKKKKDRKKEIGIVAMAIQLARFQQVLLHTCDGQRFFPGKSGLADHFGFRVFEDSIEIEDLSRAVELFLFAKTRTVFRCNAGSQRKVEPKDNLAQKPYYYPPSIFADHDAAKAAAASGHWPVAPVMGDRTIEATDGETQHAMSEYLSAVPELDSRMAVSNSERGMSRHSGTKPGRKRVARSDEPSGKPEVAYEDLRILCKDQARIEEGKAKAKQKQIDIKKKMSSIKQTRRNDEKKLRGWEQKLERLRQTLKDHEHDLVGLAEQYQEVADELKNLEKEAKVLVSDFDLAAIKRKRDELEQDEERIKKQKQALADED